MRKYPLLGLIAASVMLANGAFAHVKLLASIPTNNEQLRDAPKSLTLVFKKDVQLAMLKLTLAGRKIPVAIDRTAKPAATISVRLPALTRGQYRVEWSALSPDDGHVMRGALTFTILAAVPAVH
jgi:methionine-rich copper-binding protein CopC